MTSRPLAASRFRPHAIVRSTARPTATTTRCASRSALLWGFTAVLSAHLWLAIMVETRKPEWRDPEFFHRQQRLATLVQLEREQGRSRPLVVILGGSRTQTGRSPEHLGDGFLAYNCSQSGCLPVGERLNLVRLLDSGIKPDFVLIEVLPPVLADPGPMDHRIPAERIGLAEFRHLGGDRLASERAWVEWASLRLESWYSLRSPLLANWGLSEVFPIRNDPHPLWSSMSPLGWSPAAPREWHANQREERLGVAHRTYSWLLNDFAIQHENDRVIRDMLKTCRARGIHAALFVMPESPRFRSWYPPGAREQVGDYLAKISHEFGTPVFDTSAWIDDEAAFLDGHHLLKNAAVAFSCRFGRDCVEPWVRGK